ncbi:unnamed protein product [Clonostachys rhizophaga]|uniref:Nephrocystin-3 n=1 Tax=Clonostachys rhizophaga TaxID=160324 RepID=A0A9N9VK47_9HYPO|nr:unnamed protein product [Clonostachys rhizophaga]
MSLPPLDHAAYTIGWICALPKEMTAAIAMLDNVHEGLPQPVSDYNNYSLGSMGSFNIVVVCLPSGDFGSHQASAVAARMLATFPNLKMGLMVGIGGGVPSEENDIRLGDVVVSTPAKGFGGVVQHDMGKHTKDGGWVRTGSLNGAPMILKTTISKLISFHQIQGKRTEFYLSEMLERHPNLSTQFARPAESSDVLYEPEPEDPDTLTDWVEVARDPRSPEDSIKIHYGLISSGNQVIKSGRQRDLISSRLGGVLCFEMEAAGLMNELPCAVIRGICDYADAHKKKEWQDYAAAVAAAYAKELVNALPTTILETQIILPALSNHLADLQIEPPNFVGREQELSTLLEWASSKEICRNMAVFGLGGVGKTQIALEFAYRTREQKPYCSVFWVPVTDYLAFKQAYKQIGQVINIPRINDNGEDGMQLVKEALSDSKRVGSWLMIVDNADDMNMIFRQPTDTELIVPGLIDYIPSSPNGLTLFTTRNRKVAVRQAANNIISLEIMVPEDASKLLAKSILRQEILLNVDAVRELLGLLGFLPLAIIQAAAYINENDTTIEEYRSLYNESETEVMEVLSEDFEVPGRYKTIKNSIAATWLVSLGQLTHTNPVAIDYLSFMACLSSSNISPSLLLPAPSKKQGLEAIGALKAYSLLRKRDDGPNFDIHPLVHLATRNWLRSERKLQLWTSSAVLRLVELLPEGGHENRPTWTAYLPHARYLLNSAAVAAADGDEKVVVLAEKLGKCHYSNGEYSEAHRTYEQALELRVKISGLENRDTMRNMFGIAEALSHQGKYKEAEAQHRMILELRKKVLGQEDPEVGRSMNYLAQAMYEGGRFVESEQMHRAALALQNEVLHPEHPNALSTTSYLAQAIGQQGRYKEAEELYRELLATRIRVQGEEYPATLATMSCLGATLGDLGNYSDAEHFHRRVLDLRVMILGNRHPHTCITKRWLAEALLHQEKYEEAYRLNREALDVQTDVLGLKHPSTLLTLVNRGDIFFHQGQIGRAEKVYRQALDFQIEYRGSEHPETLKSMDSLANVLNKRGNHDEAKELYEKVFEARVRILGPGHPKTLATPH